MCPAQTVLCCVCVGLFLYVCLPVCVCLHRYIQRQEVCIECFPTLFSGLGFETGSFTKPAAHQLVKVTGQPITEILPRIEITGTSSHPCPLHGCQGSTLSHHACRAAVSLVEHFPAFVFLTTEFFCLRRF